jgi:hypothetical protein
VFELQGSARLPAVIVGSARSGHPSSAARDIQDSEAATRTSKNESMRLNVFSDSGGAFGSHGAKKSMGWAIAMPILGRGRKVTDG